MAKRKSTRKTVEEAPVKFKNPAVYICSKHPDKQVPLLFTLAFHGSEYWCPYCGANYGFFGSGVEVESTPEIKKEHQDWSNKSIDYLRALSRKVAISFMYNGNRISYKNYPPAEKEKDNQLINNWKYEGGKNHA